MYSTETNGDFCFVGEASNKEFKNICMIFLEENHQGKYIFILWNDWFFKELIDLNMNIKDYVLQNNIAITTIKSLKRISVSYSATPKDKKIIYELRDRIINDEEIKYSEEVEKNLKKYNL